MVPIDFILNFQVNASKAASGIKSMSSDSEKLAKTSEQVSTNFRSWIDSMRPEFIKNLGFKKNAGELRIYSKALENTFKTELANKFGDSIGSVSRQFKAMYKDNELKKVQQQFSDLTGTLKGMAPHINLTKTSMTEMFKSMMEARTIDPETMKSLGVNMEKIGKTFSNMKPKQQQAMKDLFETFAKSKKSVNDLKELNDVLDDTIKKQEGIDKLKNAFLNLFGFLPDGISTLRKVAVAAGAYKVSMMPSKHKNKWLKPLHNWE